MKRFSHLISVELKILSQFRHTYARNKRLLCYLMDDYVFKHISAKKFQVNQAFESIKHFIIKLNLFKQKFTEK